LPTRAQHVLARVDQLLRVPDSFPVQEVGGHTRILADAGSDADRSRQVRFGSAKIIVTAPPSSTDTT
jgi:hypothetical protein